MEMEFWIFFIGFSLLVGYFADKKGRSGVGWFFLALLTSPLLAGIALAIASDEKVHKKIEDVERKTDNLGTEMRYHQKYNDLRAELITKQLDSVRQSVQAPILDGHSQTGQQLLGVITCQNCGKTYSQSANFCPHCGAFNHLFTKCSKCGAISPNDLLYCGSCGNQLRQVVVCSHCGEKTTKQDQIYCAKCGTKLSSDPNFTNRQLHQTSTSSVSSGAAPKYGEEICPFCKEPSLKTNAVCENCGKTKR